MINRMSHVVCDECGTPGEMADDAKEARASARREGFVRVDGRDLCWRCDPNSGRCTTCGVRPQNLLSGCTSRDGIHTTGRASSKEVGGDRG